MEFENFASSCSPSFFVQTYTCLVLFVACRTVGRGHLLLNCSVDGWDWESMCSNVYRLYFCWAPKVAMV